MLIFSTLSVHREEDEVKLELELALEASGRGTRGRRKVDEYDKRGSVLVAGGAVVCIVKEIAKI